MYIFDVKSENENEKSSNFQLVLLNPKKAPAPFGNLVQVYTGIMKRYGNMHIEIYVY